MNFSSKSKKYKKIIVTFADGGVIEYHPRSTNENETIEVSVDSSWVDLIFSDGTIFNLNRSLIKSIKRIPM